MKRVWLGVAAGTAVLWLPVVAAVALANAPLLIVGYYVYRKWGEDHFN